jgi:hypothetical protein
MNVANLRQHLIDLGKVLESSGAKQAAKDLATVGGALAPFGELSLGEFR